MTALLLLPLLLCTRPAAAEAPAADAIDRIAVERNCHGCAHGRRIELQRDGRAVDTAIGTARSGSVERTLSGRVAAADFDALARQAIAAGFFDGPTLYDEPGLRDGAWVVLTIGTRSVTLRGEAGPAGLKALERAIDALEFAPERR